MKRKLTGLLLAVSLSIGLVGCGGSSNNAGDSSAGNESAESSSQHKAADGKTKISVYLGGDAADENQAVIETFNAQSETIEAELVTLADGSSGYEMLTVMYNAGNPPAVYFLEAGDVLKLTDKLMDLSELKCVPYAAAGTTEDVTVEGSLYGVPANIQAYGLLYNKAVITEIMGTDFDVESIQTTDDFVQVCEKIQAAGVTPMAVSPFDWNLGNHWFTQIYAGQSAQAADRDAFITELKAGNVKLTDNAVFNDYRKTFDTFMEYNYYKENPMETVADGNEKQAQLLATGQVAFWFHGNWAAANIRTLDEEGEYGLIPVPLSDKNAANFGKICTLVPGYFCVEKSTTTEEQQNAAMEFVNWLIMSEEGQQYVIQCGNIPAYTNNEAEITESVSRSVVEYTTSGETFPMYVKFPSDHYASVGAAMQKYLAGQQNADEMAAEIESYWLSQNE